MRTIHSTGRLLSIFALCAVLSACQLGEKKDPYIRKLDKAFETWAKNQNEFLDFYRPSFSSRYSDWETLLTDISQEGKEIYFQDVEKALALLQQVDSSQLNRLQTLEYESVRLFLQIEHEGKAYAFHECLINPVDGIHFSLFEDLSFGYSVNKKGDGDYFLAKIRAFPARITQLRSYLNACAQQGSLPPRPLLEEVQLQAENLLRTPTQKHPLYRGIARQLGNADPVMINELEATDYMIKAENMLEEYVYPAYKELLEMIEVLVKNSTDQIAVSKFVDGESFYAYQFKKYMGREVDIAGLHESGLRQMDSLEKEFPLDELMQAGELVEAAGRLRTQLSSLDSARAFSQRMKRNSLGLMDSIPQTPIYIFEMPDWALDYTPNWKYYPPSLSQHRRGVLLVDMTHEDFQGVLNHRSQLYQYGIPGSHFFHAANLQSPNSSEFANFIRFEGNARGWNLYAGDLVVQTLGLLQDYPSSLAEYQQEKLKALASLIVDTGIHTQGWSREEGMAYLMAKARLSEREAKRMTDACIVYPGKACSKWLGYQDLLSLQEKVKDQKGEKYLLQDFHNLLMLTAHSPFNLTRSRLPLLLN